VVPEKDLAVTLLTNGGGAGALFDALVRPILLELAGAELGPAPELPSESVAADIMSFVGAYERSGVRMEITTDDEGRLWFQARSTGPLAGSVPEEPAKELIVLDPATLITAESEPRLGRHLTFKFLEPSERGYGYVHFGARATPRTFD